MKNIHVPYTFSYLYLIAYMYKYAKYSEFTMNIYDIKEILQCNKNTQGYNYLMKKGSILDRYGITETTNNIPIGYDIQNFEVKYIFTNDDELLRNTFFKNKSISKKYNIKKPLYFMENEEFIISNTTLIDVRVFDFCMSKNDLGVIAFYLYSYLLYKNSQFKEGYKAGIYRLSEELNLSTGTIEKYRTNLRKYNMITVIVDEFISFKNNNSYSNITNSYEQFEHSHIEYKKLKDLNVKINKSI